MTGGPPIQKPAKRGKKPKRPLKRSWIKRTGEALKRQAVEMVRRNPIARVSARPARQEEARADKAWAKTVKKRAKEECQAFGVTVSWLETPSIERTYTHSICWGQREAAHLFSRRYKATRTDPKNGACLCHSSHAFYTEHPKAWEIFVRGHLGEAEFESLRQKAVAGAKA